MLVDLVQSRTGTVRCFCICIFRNYHEFEMIVNFASTSKYTYLFSLLARGFIIILEVGSISIHSSGLSTTLTLRSFLSY